MYSNCTGLLIYVFFFLDTLYLILFQIVLCKKPYPHFGIVATEKNSGKKTSEKYVKVGSEFLKGSKLSNVGGHRYEIKLNPSKSCAVSVTDKAVKGTDNAIIRFDRPHKNVDFNHININPKFSGKPDPHLKLPPGGLSVCFKLFFKTI
jgi:hypothetical protein